MHQTKVGRKIHLKQKVLGAPKLDLTTGNFYKEETQFTNYVLQNKQTVLTLLPESELFR
jgi:hypothetical protein